MSRWLVFASLVGLVACPGPGSSSGDASTPGVDGGASRCAAGTFESAAGDCVPVGWTVCGEGFERAPDGWSCRASLARCDAGAEAFPGQGCTPIGWTTCPTGFQPDVARGSCTPVLPDTPCTGSTRAALGAPTCVPVGDCGAPFPPAAATLFVERDAGMGPTRFGTISAALAAAPPGATIAIADGDWPDTLRPTKPVTLVGRCPGRVLLLGLPALEVVGTRGVRVEGVRIVGSLLGARVEMGGQLTLRHVVLQGNERSGIQALDRGTEVSLEDVVLRDTLADTISNTFGQGIALGGGARLTLTDVELRNNGEAGLSLLQAGTTAVLTDVVISATRPRPRTTRLGLGITVQGGAALTAERVVLDANHTTGLLVAQRGSTAMLQDVLVRDVVSGADSVGTPAGLGVSVQSGTLTWTGGGIERVTAFVDVRGADARATLRSVSAHTSTAGPSLRLGVQASQGAKVSLERVRIADTATSGVVALDVGTEVTLTDVAVHDVDGVGLRAQQGRVVGTGVRVERASLSGAQAQQQGQLVLERCLVVGEAGGGFGASANEASTLSLTACQLTGATTAGVYVRDVGTQASLLRTEVRDTRLNAGEFGQGVLVEEGASASLEDVSVVRAATAGLQVQQTGSRLTAARVTVQSTRPNGQGTRGRGANVSFGSTFIATATAFVDNQQVGVFVFDARAELDGTLVQGTRVDPDGRYGNGVQALTDGVLRVKGGAVESSGSLGAAFAEGAGLLDGVRLWRNPVALHTQDGSTIEELAAAPATIGRRQVVVTPATRFVGNESRLGSAQVPVPPQ
jgi:hypothetical protein